MSKIENDDLLFNILVKETVDARKVDARIHQSGSVSQIKVATSAKLSVKYFFTVLFLHVTRTQSS